jgi:hypothetical protein
MIRRLAKEMCEIIKASVGFGYEKNKVKVSYHLLKEMYDLEDDEMEAIFPGVYALYTIEKAPLDPDYVMKETDKRWENIEKELNKFSKKK